MNHFYHLLSSKELRSLSINLNKESRELKYFLELEKKFLSGRMQFVDFSILIDERLRVSYSYDPDEFKEKEEKEFRDFVFLGFPDSIFARNRN